MKYKHKTQPFTSFFIDCNDLVYLNSQQYLYLQKWPAHRIRHLVQFSCENVAADLLATLYNHVIHHKQTHQQDYHHYYLWVIKILLLNIFINTVWLCTGNSFVKQYVYIKQRLAGKVINFILEKWGGWF